MRKPRMRYIFEDKYTQCWSFKEISSYFCPTPVNPVDYVPVNYPTLNL